MTDLKTQAHYCQTSADRIGRAMELGEDALPLLRCESAILLRRAFKLWFAIRFAKWR